MPAFRPSSPVPGRRRPGWLAARDVVLGIVLCIALLAGGGWVLWATLGGEPASVARPGAAMGDGGGGPDDVGGAAIGPMPVTVPIVARPIPAAAGTPGVAAPAAGPIASVPAMPGLMPALVPVAAAEQPVPVPTPAPAASAVSPATADATVGRALPPVPPRLAVAPPPVQPATASPAITPMAVPGTTAVAVPPPMALPADTTFAGRSLQYGDANDPMVIAMHPSGKYRSDGTAFDGSIGDDPTLVRENLRLENARRFVMSMCRDQQGRLWVGTENEQPGDGTGGVQCFDPLAPPLHQWTQYTVKDGLGDDNGYAIACDHQNRIWVGHLNHGVSVFNHNSKGRWQCYEVIAGLSRPDTLSGPIGERVFAIKCCPTDGDVWMSTNCGLARYSDSKQTWTYLTRADGLPSDQANALAFDNAGNLYVGTQCDGIAMADSNDDYNSWRTATGPDRDVITPSGDGLPTSMINDVLAADDGTVYAATTAGLAWSRDAGTTWRYLRGRDYANTAQTRLGGPQAEWAEHHGMALLAEDYCSALAQAAGGQVWIAHRKCGVEVVALGSPGVPSPIAGTPSHQYYTVLVSDGSGVTGYAGGYGGSGLWVVGRASDATLAARSPTQSPLPAGASPPTDPELTSLAKFNRVFGAQCAEHAPRYLGEDWATQGNWVGRYGRGYAVLCSMNSPMADHVFIRLPGYSVTGSLGAHHLPADALRHWVHLVVSDESRVLYDPMIGVRRQAEWDDHGEAYPSSFDGPNIVVKVTVPSGVHRISLYFTNKDGHQGENRCRDYVIEMQNSDVAHPAIHCRVSSFYQGVVKSFAVCGPATFDLTIKRNASLNTICSAVFVDPVSENLPSASTPLPWLAGVPFGPDYGETNRPAVSSSKSTDVSYPSGTSTVPMQLLRNRYRLLSSSNITNAEQLESCRWQACLWSAEDLRYFNEAMATAWRQMQALNPTLASKQWRPFSPNVVLDRGP